LQRTSTSDPTQAAAAAPGGELRSTLKFLLVPGAILIANQVFGLSLPGLLLYGIAGIFGIALFVRSLSDPERLLAVTILSLPLAKSVPASIGFGINGINVLLVMLVIAWLSNASRHDRPLFPSLPAVGLVGAFAALSSLSAITAAVTLGTDFILEDHIFDFKAWIDQFVFFFAFVGLIRDGRMARRLVVYMVIGFLVVTVLGIQELFEKSGLATIEKSRLLGPHLQPNDFGAYLVYSVAPLIAYFLHHIFQLRAWLLAPLFGITAKLLLTTFSRGAYIGLGVAVLIAGWVRGKLFFITGALLAAGLLLAFPEFVPNSLSDRMSQTTDQDSEQLDKSSGNRLILWKAGVDMTLDHPILGTGFKAFTVLKSDYVETEVEERDNHNMYLFISSQMGIPALILFLLILHRMYAMGAALYRGSNDPWTRVVALGGVTVVAGVLGINMFGSRIVDPEVSGNFWFYLAVLAHLGAEHEPASRPAQRELR
jgi:O-antigen ligase